MNTGVVLLACIVCVSCNPVREDDITTAPVKGFKFNDMSSYSSNQYPYEIHIRPYGFRVRPPSLLAVINGEGADEGAEVHGEIRFTQPHPPNGPVIVRGNLTGLPLGPHAFTINDFGDIRQGCRNTGFHYNPHLTPHGAPTDAVRHVGDLGNVIADADGMAKIDMLDPLISLEGPRGIVGRSVVIHAKQDDMGRGNNPESRESGNAGDPIACGIIGHV